MKRRQPKHVISFILTFLLLFINIQVFASTVVHVAKVSINKTTDSLIVGQTDIIRATFTPVKATNRTVKWTSSNSSIAKVDLWGKITSLRVGTTTITGVTADRGLKVYCKMTVKPKPVIRVIKVKVNKTTDSLTVGQTDIIRATFTPTNATNRTVKWTSSNTTIAKVDIYGKVTSLKAGTATITGVTVDKKLKVYCKIIVNPKPVVHVTKVSLNKTADSLTVGATGVLTSTIAPANVTNKNVTWKSSNSTIATIDNNGKVTAVSAGTATITVTTIDGSKTATCLITVNNTSDNTDITSKFTDPNFKTKVYSLIGKASPTPILYSDVKNIKTLNLLSLDISSLNGIEYFTGLTSLQCGDNKLTTLDVSKNAGLTVLLCSSNNLTTLDVSKNTALTELLCEDNLANLDVSKNTALTELYCANNKLTTLDVSKNTALTELYCNSNNLTTLDVSKNTALTELYCNSNNLTSLDVSKNTAITNLDCYSNHLTTLDVNNNKALTNLYCNSNNLTNLDLSKNIALANLYCCYNNLTVLYATKDSSFFYYIRKRLITSHIDSY